MHGSRAAHREPQWEMLELLALLSPAAVGLAGWSGWLAPWLAPWSVCVPGAVCNHAVAGCPCWAPMDGRQARVPQQLLHASAV